MSTESSVRSDVTDERPGPPPLRIHHLMACAVVTAVELSLIRFMWLRSPQQQMAAANGFFACLQVLSAIGLTLTGFSIYWWRKGYASFSQPGQMLLLHYAVSFVLQLASMAFVVAMFGIDGHPRDTQVIWLYSLVLGLGSLVFTVLVPIVFYAWCAWKIADSAAWRVLFALCALTSLLSSTFFMIAAQFVVRFQPSNMQMFFAIPYLARGGILLPLGVIAAMSDLSAKRPRSWTHWAGLALWLLGQVSLLLVGLYYMYFWHLPS